MVRALEGFSSFPDAHEIDSEVLESFVDAQDQSMHRMIGEGNKCSIRERGLEAFHGQIEGIEPSE